MKKLAFTLLALAGCNADAIAIYGVDEADEAVVEEGAAVLGYAVDFVDSPKGAVELKVTVGDFLVNGKMVAGYAYDVVGCERGAKVQRRPVNIAHEIGHTLGLGHVDNPENVMWRVEGADHLDLSEKQIRRMDRSLGRLNVCRR